MTVDTRELVAFQQTITRIPGRLQDAEHIYSTLAGSMIVAGARSFASMGNHMQQRASADVQLGPDRITYGGKPYDMGAEFGALQYKQFEAWRGHSDDAGYFLFPAVRKFQKEDSVAVWFKEIYSRVLGSAFPDRS